MIVLRAITIAAHNYFSKMLIRPLMGGRAREPEKTFLEEVPAIMFFIGMLVLLTLFGSSVTPELVECPVANILCVAVSLILAEQLHRRNFRLEIVHRAFIVTFFAIRGALHMM